MDNISKLPQFRRSLIHAVFEGAELEGLGLTYAKTEDIIKHYEKSKNLYSWAEIEDVSGVLSAYQYIVNKIEKKEPLDLTAFKTINQIVDKYEEHDRAGHWRNEPKGIGGTHYIPPILKGGEYARIVENITTLDITFENVVKFFARLCKTQCFHDGNKRTALIFCNAILISANLQIIRIVDHITFARKLVSFYEDENKIEDFYQYVKNTSHLSFPKLTPSHPGQTIKKLLIYTNMNENQLAKIVGVNRSHINKIIKGVSKPSNELAKAIANVLHVHWETLI